MMGRRRTAEGTEPGWLLWLLAALFALTTLGGCRAMVGGHELFFRVSREIPPMVQEDGDGQRVELPGALPEGDAVFLFVRGRL
jgi:hypothetical protein